MRPMSIKDVGVGCIIGAAIGGSFSPSYIKVLRQECWGACQLEFPGANDCALPFSEVNHER